MGAADVAQIKKKKKFIENCFLCGTEQNWIVQTMN